MKPIAFSVPIKAVNTLNARQRWAVRAKRVKAERQRTLLAFRASKPELAPLVEVVLTRVGPRALDSDNLQGACKGVRDQVAHMLGVDDGGPLVRWTYAQERGEYAVRVEIRAVATEAA